MRLIWTATALRDREGILDYIADDNPGAALRMSDAFAEAARRLTRFPRSGRPGRIPGTRELVVHPNYLIVYVIEDDTVAVAAVVHAARQWPSPDV